MFRLGREWDKEEKGEKFTRQRWNKERKIGQGGRGARKERKEEEKEERISGRR